MTPIVQYYADVILPLPIYGTFTYRVPQKMVSEIGIGFRVIVPFGRKKFYTAIIASLSTIKPSGNYDIKEISLILDKSPIVRNPQLKFWDWISEYYLCSTGDVYKAAMPAGLKVESETFVELNEDFEENTDNRLSEQQAILCQTLGHNGSMTPAEIEKKTGLKNIEASIAGLIECGAVIISEKLVERYRAKKETYIRLLVDRNDNQAMHTAFDAVRGAKKQETALIAIYEALKKNNSDEVSRAQIIERTGLLPAIFTAMAAKGLIEIYRKEINRFKFSGSTLGELPKLSDEQSRALDDIHRSFLSRDISLLHGVTSSGKTEIYIHLIDFLLKRGEQVLYLVPEIALTTQLTRRLQRVFGNKVLIYHSKFSDNERVDIWKKLLTDSSPCIVIGARSSLFLPYSHLGMVIVDEEHEQSYKQYDPAPRYNARDTAMVLASMHGAKTLLGSATPSIETYYKASTGRYGLISLSERYEGVQMPSIEIIDMTRLRKQHPNMRGLMSPPLIKLTREALEHKEQVILFHNRRGFAPVVTCKQCAFIPKCQNCDVSLTYHRHSAEMVCHYCGSTYKLPNICPACKEPAIEVFGYGTERIEDEVERLFPDSSIARMDLDTTRNKDSYENIIDNFSQQKSQILVGTQMVTKGLDFAGVSLVGVLNADAIINFPDFRSAERAFNMLEQVSGRAGRRNSQGKVVVQTSQPAHPIINFLQTHDYTAYYEHELDERRRYNYPPFTRVINIYLKHRDEAVLVAIANHYGDMLRQLFGNRILGPEEPYISRIQSLYIRKFMIKIEVQASMRKVKDILRSVYENIMTERANRALIIYYDVDPM